MSKWRNGWNEQAKYSILPYLTTDFENYTDSSTKGFSYDVYETVTDEMIIPFLKQGKKLYRYYRPGVTSGSNPGYVHITNNSSFALSSYGSSSGSVSAHSSGVFSVPHTATGGWIVNLITGQVLTVLPN